VSWGPYSGDDEEAYSAEPLPELCYKADVQAFSRAFQPSRRPLRGHRAGPPNWTEAPGAGPRTLGLSHRRSCPASKRKDLALLVTGGLALARCGLNPVLYAFLGLRFRQDLRRLLRGRGCSPGPHHRGRCPRRPRLSSCSAPTETNSISFWDY
ncbi:hypothetical protein E2I00_019154, partial [Balaenoptera physalus]